MAEAKEVKQSTTASPKPCPAQLAEGLDLEEQLDELMALAAIYEGEDLEICEHDNPHADMPGGIFNIPIFPPQPFQVKLTKDIDGIKSHSSWSKRRGAAAMRGRGRGKTESNGKNKDDTDDTDTARRRRRNSSSSSTDNPPKVTDEPTVYDIKRLCPMTLTFAFPHDYPSVNPPSFTLSCCWLDKRNLSRLCQQLDCIWAEYQGCAVVMNWVSFLQGELTDFLGLQSPYDLGKVLSPLNNHHPKEEEPFDIRGFQTFGIIDEVLPKILDFNLITCEVCGDEKPGSDCLRLISCNEHTYCRECSKGWFETQVDQGSVAELTCPGYKCTKPILPTEIASVVPPSVYQRYEKLLLKTALDTMEDISYCPRPHCQFPVVIEGTMGLCHKCKHAFCSRCQNTYHGHTPCKLKADKYAQICKDYEAGSESERHQLEMLYGKRNIQTAVNETKSTQWLEVNSKQCPNCSTFIQKNDGCNKMTCIKCRAFWCWLCNEELSRSNPYSHYQHPTSPCANRLFEGIQIDDPDFPDDLEYDDEQAPIAIGDFDLSGDEDDYILFI